MTAAETDADILLMEAVLKLLCLYEESLATMTRKINEGFACFAPGHRAVLSFNLSKPLALRPCGALVVYGLGPDEQPCGQPSVRLATEGFRTWWRCEKHRDEREPTCLLTGGREEQSDGRG